MNPHDKAIKAFGRLLNIMDELREKCPWDKEQTIDSIRHLTIEEVYELSDAIIKGNLEDIKKESGDLLLHIVFYSRIASETNAFNIESVINSLCEKLVRRHPHIYGDVTVKDAEQVKQNWEQIKLKEKPDPEKQSVLDGVPLSMPSLVKAMRIQEKAAQVGFDWENKNQVWEKVKEEVNEFEQADNTKDKQAEFGDLLFALINYARFENINPDDALEKTNHKFVKRFAHIEKKAREKGLQLNKMKLVEMEELWNEAKSLS